MYTGVPGLLDVPPVPRIEADGGQPVTRVPDQAGYEAALRAKLLEEAHEAQATGRALPGFCM